MTARICERERGGAESPEEKRRFLIELLPYELLSSLMSLDKSRTVHVSAAAVLCPPLMLSLVETRDYPYCINAQ